MSAPGRFAPSRASIARLLRFGLVAAISGSVYAAVCAALIVQAGVEPKLASVYAYVVSIFVNFAGQRRFTFASQNSILPEVLRFCVVHGVNIGVSYLITLAVVQWFGLHFIFGIAATLLVIPLSTYVLLTLWVFQNPAKGAKGDASADRHGDAPK
jgi:putative flippase GtrA